MLTRSIVASLVAAAAASAALAAGSTHVPYGAYLRRHVNFGSCDYRDAYKNNGWGWNSRTGTSCPPLKSDASSCDYRGADKNNGWGWDTFTGTSCPPSR